MVHKEPRVQGALRAMRLYKYDVGTCTTSTIRTSFTYAGLKILLRFILLTHELRMESCYRTSSRQYSNGVTSASAMQFKTEAPTQSATTKTHYSCANRIDS